MLKAAIANLAKEAKVTSVTTRYFFLHTNARERKRGSIGYACKKAEDFVAACNANGLKTEFTIFDEEGTGVAVTERFDDV